MEDPSFGTTAMSLTERVTNTPSTSHSFTTKAHHRTQSRLALRLFRGTENITFTGLCMVRYFPMILPPYARLPALLWARVNFTSKLVMPIPSLRTRHRFILCYGSRFAAALFRNTQPRAVLANTE